LLLLELQKFLPFVLAVVPLAIEDGLIMVEPAAVLVGKIIFQ
jgi:hypothetical protein